MRKSVRLSDDAYFLLKELQMEDETLSDAVRRIAREIKKS